MIGYFLLLALALCAAFLVNKRLARIKNCIGCGKPVEDGQVECTDCLNSERAVY